MTARPSRHLRVRYAGRIWTLLAAHEHAVCIERRGHARWVPVESVVTDHNGSGLTRRATETPAAFLRRCLSVNPTLSTRAARERQEAS